MRRFSILLIFLGLACPIRAATRVSVAQLEQYLTSKQASRESDSEVADRLESVELTEQLTARTLARIASERKVGPRTAEQLRLIAASSIFCAPPAAELPARAAPDQVEQGRMMDSAVEYVNGVLQRLPDFLAIRTTDTFDNTPKEGTSKHAKPKAELRLVLETRREIAYRNGQEAVGSAPDDSGKSPAESASASAGFTTKGEFGSVLKTVLGDSFKGSVVWSRWQMSESGALVAVFHYSVPRLDSHYLVDFCCYGKSEDDPAQRNFTYRAGYHGELYVDPETGVVDRIALEAELTEDAPVMISETAVQYGHVDIGGKDYICPVHSVAVSQVHNPAMEVGDKIGPQRLVNVVRFSNYHKFASTLRIVP
jgi:hypothetical protein